MQTSKRQTLNNRGVCGHLIYTQRMKRSTTGRTTAFYVGTRPRLTSWKARQPSLKNIVQPNRFYMGH